MDSINKTKKNTNFSVAILDRGRWTEVGGPRRSFSRGQDFLLCMDSLADVLKLPTRRASGSRAVSENGKESDPTVGESFIIWRPDGRTR